MSGVLTALCYASRLIFLPFASPYGRRTNVTRTGTGVQTATGTASIKFALSNDITGVTTGTGSSAANPAGFVDPVGADFYYGFPSSTLWLYFNRTSETLDTGPEGNSTVSTSAGGAWVNVSGADQSVTASAQTIAASIGTSNNGSASATYAVYGIQSSATPSGFPQGTLMGNVRVECFATATRT